MTEHTPGPWRYRPNEHDDWGWVRGPDIDGLSPLVACAQSGGFNDEATLDQHRRDGTDPYGANALLIAAAPDMLAALKGLADAHESAIRGEGFDPQHCDCPVLDVARAAIAKATGAES